jgi:16S rRNA (guanine966-N2)-methyltransferase
MRIIAGSDRGRTLVAPKGTDTRPTQDYVRESLFNILQNIVPEAQVLDLFAGSGALALEALSRGAQYAVLADNDAQAYATIQRNIDTLKAHNRTKVYRSEWQTTLASVATEKRRFSLVFLDPPYRLEGIEAIFAKMAELSLLETDALIVAERARGNVPMPDKRFEKTDTRRYGDTEIYFFVYRGEEQGHAE